MSDSRSDYYDNLESARYAHQQEEYRKLIHKLSKNNHRILESIEKELKQFLESDPALTQLQWRNIKALQKGLKVNGE